MPNGFGYEWTDLTFQQKSAGNTALLVFPICVLLVFLILSAQYESWALPLAVILIVPMCLLSAMAGVWLKGSDNNVLTQIGFIVLVGLACKNAILIVEFARERVEHGLAPVDAAIEACRLRLRPILMTSFAFIMGVIPLVIASGAGSEMRQAIGIAVFAGMLGVTSFGLFLTPVFFVTIETWLARRKQHPDYAPSPVNAAGGQPASIGRRGDSSCLTGRREQLAALVTAILVLGGCAVGPNYHRPDTPVDAHFANAGEPGFAETEAVEHYWTSFDDPMLTGLVDDALGAQQGFERGRSELAGRACRAKTGRPRSVSDGESCRQLHAQSGFAGAITRR